MGTRGPVRDPDSRRGRREVKNGVEMPQGIESITFPSDSDQSSVEQLFQQIVDDLQAANIPVKQKDALAIKCVAQNLRRLRLAEERQAYESDLEAKEFFKSAALCASITKDLMKDLAALGATPVATMRLIKTPPKTEFNPAADAVNDIFDAS